MLLYQGAVEANRRAMLRGGLVKALMTRMKTLATATTTMTTTHIAHDSSSRARPDSGSSSRGGGDARRLLHLHSGVMLLALVLWGG